MAAATAPITMLTPRPKAVTPASPAHAISDVVGLQRSPVELGVARPQKAQVSPAAGFAATALRARWPVRAIWAVRALLLTTLLLQTACTTAPVPPVPVFSHDPLFGAPTATAGAQDIFALSPAMRVFADEHLSALNSNDTRAALLGALYRSGSLQLRYDDSRTRTAAQAFDDRAGHCLSLVLMTAAFAKHLGLPVSYQAVAVDPIYDRRGALQTSSGHINLVLSKRGLGSNTASRHYTRASPDEADLVVDFLPGSAVARVPTHTLEEHTVLAMFHNNRAAEHLQAGDTAGAYWSARAAVLADARFAAARNTLGVVYLRAGLAAAAQRVFQQVLQADASHVAALVNLQQAFRKQGLSAQADETAARLAQLQPRLPFQAFDQGQQALQAGDYPAAQRFFELELKVQPQRHDVHFWAAVASWRLGDTRKAAQHLRHAREYSPGAAEAQRYSAKLQGLQSRSP